MVFEKSIKWMQINMEMEMRQHVQPLEVIQEMESRVSKATKGKDKTASNAIKRRININSMEWTKCL